MLFLTLPTTYCTQSLVRVYGDGVFVRHQAMLSSCVSPCGAGLFAFDEALSLDITLNAHLGADSSLDNRTEGDIDNLGRQDVERGVAHSEGPTPGGKFMT